MCSAKYGHLTLKKPEIYSIANRSKVFVFCIIAESLMAATQEHRHDAAVVSEKIQSAQIDVGQRWLLINQPLQLCQSKPPAALRVLSLKTRDDGGNKMWLRAQEQ